MLVSMSWLFFAPSADAWSSVIKTSQTWDSRSKSKLHLTLVRRNHLLVKFVNLLTPVLGPLHKHGWMPHPKNGPEEFVIVYDSKELVYFNLPVESSIMCLTISVI